jgi:hypothetical protein
VRESVRRVCRRRGSCAPRAGEQRAETRASHTKCTRPSPACSGMSCLARERGRPSVRQPAPKSRPREGAAAAARKARTRVTSARRRTRSARGRPACPGRRQPGGVSQSRGPGCLSVSCSARGRGAPSRRPRACTRAADRTARLGGTRQRQRRRRSSSKALRAARGGRARERALRRRKCAAAGGAAAHQTAQQAASPVSAGERACPLCTPQRPLRAPPPPRREPSRGTSAEEESRRGCREGSRARAGNAGGAARRGSIRPVCPPGFGRTGGQPTPRRAFPLSRSCQLHSCAHRGALG